MGKLWFWLWPYMGGLYVHSLTIGDNSSVAHVSGCGRRGGEKGGQLQSQRIAVNDIRRTMHGSW